KQLKGAIDEAERAALIRSSVINALASIAFVACMLLVAAGARGTVMLVATIAAWVGFMAVIFHQTLVVQPRAMRRRHALEAQRDPVAAARRRRRERIHCWIGGTVGFVSGCAGVVLGLNAAGV